MSTPAYKNKRKRYSDDPIYWQKVVKAYADSKNISFTEAKNLMER